MGRQIIKQPDGNYAIFSSFSDTIIVWNATSHEIENYFVEEAKQRASREIREILEALARDCPEEVYYQFVMTWQEALDMDREHGGEAWRELIDKERTPTGDETPEASSPVSEVRAADDSGRPDHV